MRPELARFEIQRFAAKEAAGAWRTALAEFDETTATVLKREGGSAVYRSRMVGRDVVVKVRELAGLKERVKQWTGSTRGLRHWRGADLLKTLGVATARPLALAIERGALGAREWLVLELLPGKTLLQHIADRDLTVKQEHEAARRVGRQVSQLSKGGHFNRDHKPSNIILMPGPDGLSPAIIDCVGLRRGSDQSQRMLHGLAVEPMGLGILPRRTLLARVIQAVVNEDFEDFDLPESAAAIRVAKAAARHAYRDLVVQSLKDHGDPTPRTNPLR